MSKKVLLIEDEELLIALLQKKLGDEGYEVSLARNGEEGLKMMRETKPDIILLDIIMPKMGGFEVMEEIIKIAPEDAKPKIVETESYPKKVYQEKRNVFYEKGIEPPKNPFNWQ